MGVEGSLVNALLISLFFIKFPQLQLCLGSPSQKKGNVLLSWEYASNARRVLLRLLMVGRGLETWPFLKLLTSHPYFSLSFSAHFQKNLMLPIPETLRIFSLKYIASWFSYFWQSNLIVGSMLNPFTTHPSSFKFLKFCSCCFFSHFPCFVGLKKILCHFNWIWGVQNSMHAFNYPLYLEVPLNF